VIEQAQLEDYFRASVTKSLQWLIVKYCVESDQPLDYVEKFFPSQLLLEIVQGTIPVTHIFNVRFIAERLYSGINIDQMIERQQYSNFLWEKYESVIDRIAMAGLMEGADVQQLKQNVQHWAEPYYLKNRASRRPFLDMTYALKLTEKMFNELKEDAREVKRLLSQALEVENIQEKAEDQLRVLTKKIETLRDVKDMLGVQTFKLLNEYEDMVEVLNVWQKKATISSSLKTRKVIYETAKSNALAHKKLQHIILPRAFKFGEIGWQNQKIKCENLNWRWLVFIIYAPAYDHLHIFQPGHYYQEHFRYSRVKTPGIMFKKIMVGAKIVSVWGALLSLPHVVSWLFTQGNYLPEMHLANFSSLFFWMQVSRTYLDRTHRPLKYVYLAYMPYYLISVFTQSFFNHFLFQKYKQKFSRVSLIDVHLDRGKKRKLRQQTERAKRLLLLYRRHFMSETVTSVEKFLSAFMRVLKNKRVKKIGQDIR